MKRSAGNEVELLDLSDYNIFQSIMKSNINNKMLKTFEILNSYKLFPYAGMNECHDREMFEYNMNSQTTNDTYIDRVP